MLRQRLGIFSEVPFWPGLAVVGLMVLWGYHDGGYDADTWYWGSLVVLSLLCVVAVGRGTGRLRLSGPARLALGAFSLYVAWSYLSIAWSQSPGDALQGSNRSLLYLLVFALFAVLPWTAEAALLILVAFVLGVGAIEMSILARLTDGSHAAGMFTGARLVVPTGYFNANAALFTLTALLAIVLAVRRELPALLRGMLVAISGGCLQLALLAQSRGWLFTLPLVAIVALAVTRDRLRVACAALLPIATTLALLPRLLHVFRGFTTTDDARQAIVNAGTAGLLVCGALLLAGTLVAAGDARLPVRRLSDRRRRTLGAAAAALALTFIGTAGLAATHGHPFRFVSRQWSGFTHLHDTSETSSHFSQAGSGRYDFWRVSLDAFVAHPIGGLGQDNFADYYVTRRRTNEEPQWTHSLEMRMLAHTGIVGLGLFAAFVIAGLAAARRGLRDKGRLAPAIAGAGLLPLAVWLIHGSIDWFWEMPALTGPALGFLAMAGALGTAQTGEIAARPRHRRIPWGVRVAAGGLTIVSAVIVLGFPYLSVREVSVASDLRQPDPGAALGDLAAAAKLNPLSADPGRLGGTIALQTGQYIVAEQRFRQASSREPGGWFSWLGDGLAASALGDAARAHHDYKTAASINSRQPVVPAALARVYTRRPLTPAEALGMVLFAK